MDKSGGWLVIPDVNPQPWAIGTISTGRSGGKIRGRMSPNAQLVTYQEAINEHCAGLELPFFMTDIELQFLFARAVEGKAKPADVTNLQKATEDALQGILFANDRQVVKVQSEIYEQGPGVRPFAAVHIRAWSAYTSRPLPLEVSHTLSKARAIEADNRNLGPQDDEPF